LRALFSCFKPVTGPPPNVNGFARQKNKTFDDRPSPLSREPTADPSIRPSFIGEPTTPPVAQQSPLHVNQRPNKTTLLKTTHSFRRSRQRETRPPPPLKSALSPIFAGTFGPLDLLIADCGRHHPPHTRSNLTSQPRAAWSEPTDPAFLRDYLSLASVTRLYPIGSCSWSQASF
jgi:hypothetical protein